MFLIPAAYFLVRGPRPVGAASLVAAAGIAFGLAWLIPPSPVIAESNELRLAAISPALQAIAARPLFGWGLLSDSAVLSDIIGRQNFVDDTYLSLAVETGLVGLAAFVLLAGAIVLATRRGWAGPLGLALAIAVASVLGMAVLASVFQVTQGYAAFFVLAGLAVATSLIAADRGGSAAST
jgi:O-antigen ligase